MRWKDSTAPNVVVPKEVATRYFVPVLGTLTLLAAGLSGCAISKGATRQQDKIERLRMDPLQFSARRDADGNVVIDQQDAQSLFRKAGEAFEESRFEDAIRAYAAILTDFGESEFVPAARYNLALAHERAGRYDDAIRLYQAIIEAFPDAPDALDAQFQIAACLEAQERWVDADAALANILARTGLADRDVLEATVRRGHAMFALERLDEAEERYRQVLRRRRGGGEPRSQHLSRPHFAQAQFGVARIEHTRFSSQPIRLPQAVMERDIQDKAATFLRAQAAYLRSMSYKEFEISAGSLLRIGKLYEDFFEDFMSAPLPDELENQEEVDAYLGLLRTKIRPLLERAVHVHKRNLRFATRLGEDHELVGRTREHLERLTKLLETIPEPNLDAMDAEKSAKKSPEEIITDRPKVQIKKGKRR